VVTGVLLALGFLGLAAGDEIVNAFSRRFFLNAVVLSWGVTALRAVLEKAAAPEPWARLVGVTWLPPVIGAYFAVCLNDEGKGFKELVRYLLAYAFAVRGVVALVMLVASGFHLGTHYDLSRVPEVGFLGWSYHFGEERIRGIVILTAASQLVFWPLHTVLTGILGAWIAKILSPAGKGERDLPTRSPRDLGAEGG
jgi:hypothetical protein